MSSSTESVEHFHINSPCPSDERKSNGAVTTASDQTDNNLIEKSIGSRTSSSDSGCESDLFRFGWSKWQPKCMQSLLSAKWALFWMCWAGALQGNATRNYSLQTKKIYFISSLLWRSKITNLRVALQTLHDIQCGWIKTRFVDDFRLISDVNCSSRNRRFVAMSHYCTTRYFSRNS